jgi:hypothetical protein
MRKSVKQRLQEKINRMKKTFYKILKHGREMELPQLLPLPVRNKKYLRGTDLL